MIDDEDRDYFYFLSKRCKICAEEFFRPRGQQGVSNKQWDARLFCSITCRNRTITTRGMKHGRRKND